MSVDPSTSPQPAITPVLSRLRPGPKPAGRVTACETCGESKNDGRRECGKCRSARYRADPERLERSRQSARDYRARQLAGQLTRFADQMKETGR